MKRALPLLLAMLVTMALWAPALPPSVQLVYRDTGRLHYPVKRFIADALARGELPLWDARTEAGTSILGQVAPGLLHPFTLLYVALPFDVAFKLNHLLNLPLAALGAYLLARRLGASRCAASAAGIIYGTNGFLVSMVSANLTFAMGAAGLPLAIEAVLRACKAFRPATVLWAGVALALLMYAGEPQSLLFAGLIAAPCAVGMALSGAARGVRERSAAGARALAMCAVCGAAGFALSGPAAIPAVASLQRSSRFGGVSAEERAKFNNSPWRLPGLLLPQAFDDQVEGRVDSADAPNPYPRLFAPLSVAFGDSITLGAPALLLAALGAFAGKRGRALILGGVILTLASTGPNLGIDDALRWLLPPMRWFRYAEKLMAPASLLLALAAAFGLDEALRRERPRTRALLTLAVLLGLTTAGSALLIDPSSQQAVDLVLAATGSTSGRAARGFLTLLRPGLWVTAALSASVALVALVHVLRPAAHRLAGALAAASCAGAALASTGSLLLVGPIDIFHGPFPLAERLVERAGPGRDHYRVFTASGPLGLRDDGHNPRQLSVAEMATALMPQFETLAGLDGASSYFAAPDELYNALLSRAPYNAMRLLGVRFVVLMTSVAEARAAAARGFVQVGPGLLIREMLPLLPPAMLIGSVRAAEPEEATEILADPSFDPTRLALIERAAMPAVAAISGDGSAAPGSAALTRSGLTRKVVVQANAPSLAVISEHFDPGWSARVDGLATPVVRVDGLALGVPVPAGRHELELRFIPVGLIQGMLLAAGGAAILGLWAAARRRHSLSPT